MKITNLTELTDEILQRLQLMGGESEPGCGRILVALAGAPASGKSTLAEQLRVSVDQRLDRSVAAVFPMDGYHYDNAIIEPLGLLPRKGSPETFDVSGFENTLARLKPLAADATGASLVDVAVPVFDRELDLARAGARVITPEHQVLIVEGNYLLLASEPWSRLASYFDITAMLHVSMDVLEKRLIERWLAHDHTEQQATERAWANDLPNAVAVIEQSRQAEYQISTG